MRTEGNMRQSNGHRHGLPAHGRSIPYYRRRILQQQRTNQIQRRTREIEEFRIETEIDTGYSARHEASAQLLTHYHPQRSAVTQHLRGQPRLFLAIPREDWRLWIIAAIVCHLDWWRIQRKLVGTRGYEAKPIHQQDRRLLIRDHHVGNTHPRSSFR